MVTGLVFTTAEVLGFENVDELSVGSLQVGHGGQLRFVLVFFLFQRLDVVQGLGFTGDGVFHGLEGTKVFAVLGFLVQTRANFILSSGVDLQLTGNTLDDVQFPSRSVLVYL